MWSWAWATQTRTGAETACLASEEKLSWSEHIPARRPTHERQWRAGIPANLAIGCRNALHCSYWVGPPSFCTQER